MSAPVECCDVVLNHGLNMNVNHKLIFYDIILLSREFCDRLACRKHTGARGYVGLRPGNAGGQGLRPTRGGEERAAIPFKSVG